MSEADQDKLLQKGLKSIFDEELRASMSKKLQQEYGIGRTHKGETKVVKMPLLRKLMPIAAAVLLLISVFVWMIPSRSAQDLAMAWIQQQEVFHPGLTKGSQEVELNRTEAIQAFDATAYEKAASLFSAITNPTLEDRYYLGLSYFLGENYEAATEIFESMYPSDHQFEEEVQWYLALSYLMQNQNDKANTTLSNIQNEDWNYQEAQKLLRSLK